MIFRSKKNKLFLLFESKSFLNIRDPIGLRCFPLRVSLSPLKDHKRCHNFSDTISGICGCYNLLQRHKKTPLIYYLHFMPFKGQHL